MFYKILNWIIAFSIGGVLAAVLLNPFFLLFADLTGPLVSHFDWSVKAPLKIGCVIGAGVASLCVWGAVFWLGVRVPRVIRSWFSKAV